MPKKIKCSYCEKEAIIKGGEPLCSGHYARKRKGADMTAPMKGRGAFECCVEGCSRKRYRTKSGMCRLHDARLKKGAPLESPMYSKRVRGSTCSVSGCEEPDQLTGLCQFHYTRKKGGIPFSQKRKAKAGDGYIGENGYKYVRGKLEHRTIMENKLGRALLPHEEVHHKNGQRADNRIANLELWSTSQPAGQRVEDKIAWCKAFLAEYGEM